MVFKSIFGKKKSQETKQDAKTQLKKEIEAPTENTQQNDNQEEPPVALHLENSMVENIREDNPSTRTRVYQELLFSNMLLALSDDAVKPEAKSESGKSGESPEDAHQTPDNQINVAIMANPTGVQFAAAFTSAKAARAWKTEGGQYISVRGQDIFRLLENSPAEVIVINPGSAPFIALEKNHYRQLAMGIVPTANQSPVMMPTEEEQKQNGESGIQVTFPEDAFSDEQKQHALDILIKSDKISAAAVGAILPPQADKEKGWLRTVFLRTAEVDLQGQNVQDFCHEVRKTIVDEADSFKELSFEVGIMPDPDFWKAVNENKICLFDKDVQ